MNARLILAAAFGFSSLALAAPEPWADQRLAVHTGLAFWLDAAKINPARAAAGLPGLADGAPVDHFPDASGARRDLVQPASESRPIYRRTDAGAVLRFDGRDDFLAATNVRSEWPEATLFLVAAPRGNAGDYRGFISAHRAGFNDYLSGFNLDLGKSASPGFTALNVEGAGFRGERNLLNQGAPFGSFHIVVVQLGVGKKAVRAFLDGTTQGARDRTAEVLRIDQLTVGARCYSSEGKPPAVASFLDGEIAELLVFDRALPDAERAQVTAYLTTKHAALLATPPDGVQWKPLVAVKDPPLVQMLVPGFAVRELPIALTNIDCVRYRHDGRLVAGAYNGKIWLLTDTDNDGLEDKAELYWESDDLKNVIGMALTPKGDPRGDGVFVATAGRILFIPDKDRNQRGDEQIVIASDWEKQASPGGGGSVDAVGLALGPDGSIYFGLGTSAYNNAYLLDKEGRAQYRVESERGTILRIAPDFSKREIICTGIRYPLGAAFNRHGDLFVTEQEGATWLPNGNAFDELLHIQRGRHYGFPPRHPRHLPGVIDEPSTFDYAPQHQSTCGLVFNERSKDGTIFGPAWWEGDALVAGEARGKIWRTKLAKTSAGYVAQTSLIACLARLTVDLAISPRGDLVLATHSGEPDWGTGPQGPGQLFKISYTARETPQPVLAWSAAPDELRVAFDRELEPAALKNVAKQIDITRGRYVAAGDRFEALRPGYQAVKDQLVTPREDVPVLGITLSPDRRTLAIATPPQNSAVSLAITLPSFAESTTAPGLPRHPQIDLATDLCGIDARWQAASGTETWNGWLPHLDLAIARELTSASSEHARLWALLKKPGTLTLRGQLNLWQMLHPAVQPGAKLDYEPPVEKVRVEISGSAPKRIERDAREGVWEPFDISVETGPGEPRLAITWSTADDPRPRPFPVRRFLLPWASSKAAPADPITPRIIPELTGGNWLRGRQLYFGKANCHGCHAVRGEGGPIGPDLSNLVHRDFTSVVRDIREPGAALNPEHLAYQVALKDGTELVAVVFGDQPDKLRLGDATGAVKEIARSNVRSLVPLSTSLMPPGLLDALSPAEQRDLLTFLLMPALEPAPIAAPNPPPPRLRAELEKVLVNRQPAPAKLRPLKLLLVYGKKDHGRGEHDYPQWAERWSKLLGLAEKVEVTTHNGWPTPQQFASYDVLIFYSNNPEWKATRQPELDDFIQRGGGAVFIHWALEGRDDAPALAECIGLASNTRTTKYRHGELELTFPQPAHPITRGFGPTRFLDESYWQLVGDPRRVQLLGEQIEDGAARPQLWTVERGSGRVFVCIPGHYTWTFDDPLFRVLVLRGICWAAKEPVDRLVDLATIGARIR